MIFDISQPTLLGVAAFIAAIGGILSTVIGARRARREERDKSDELCRKRLRETRAESEELADALHKLRMSHHSENDLKKVNDILERWSHLE